MTRSAISIGLNGLVIDGSIRDIDEIIKMSELMDTLILNQRVVDGSERLKSIIEWIKDIINSLNNIYNINKCI